MKLLTASGFHLQPLPVPLVFFLAIFLGVGRSQSLCLQSFLACPGAPSAWTGTFSTGGEQNLFDTDALGLGGTDQL